MLMAAAGGAIGSAGRYLVNVAALRAWGPAFPWSTLIVNAAGCLVMGIVAELIAERFGNSAELRTFVMTGILGGFTTFSAFSIDFASLVERKETALAFVYLGASVGLALVGVFAGVALARALLH